LKVSYPAKRNSVVQRFQPVTTASLMEVQFNTFLHATYTDVFATLGGHHNNATLFVSGSSAGFENLRRAEF
jgi:hypothetical protein